MIARLEKKTKTNILSLEDDFDESVYVEMLNHFTGRKDLFARKWKNKDDKIGYIPVKEPFSLKVIENHLKGVYTAGIYPVNLNSKTALIAFDFDINKPYQDEILTNKNLRDKLYDKLQSAVISLIKKLQEFNLKGFIEYSGFKGYHIWIFSKSAISAPIAKLFAEKVANSIDYEKKYIHIETFPKQKRVSYENPGNLIKLPLGVHLKTGERSFFTDENFAPISTNDFFSEHIGKNRVENIYLAIKRLNPTKIAKSIPGTKTNQYDVKQQPQFYPEKKVDLENHKQYQWLISKCYTIRTLVKKIENDNEISNQERLVLTYTLGHIPNGSQIVNKLLSQCINVSPENFMKSSLSGNPVSCPKIRSRIKKIIDVKKCNCRFSNLLNSYPHPLLHLRELQEDSALSANADNLKLRNFVENYLEMKKEYKDLRAKMINKEKQLIGFFRDAGIKNIETSFGTLKINIKDGKISFTVEL